MKMWRDACFFTFLCLLSCPGLRAQILLNIRADTTTRLPDLNVRLELANQGKEAAHDLQISLRNGGDVALPGQRSLAPGAGYTTETNLNISGKAAGKYPLFVTVGYADQNGYQFSAILCASYFIEQSTSSDIFGTLTTEPLADRGSIRLQLKNLAAQDRSFTLTLFTPRELSVDSNQSMTLKPGEEKSAAIPIRNFSALPGSNYPLYAVLEYDRDGRHFTNIILTHIQTVARTGLFTRYRIWLLGAAGAFAAFGILLLATRFFSRASRRREKPSAP